MKSKHYDTLILGATFLGIAYALGNKEHSIVIERSSLIGSEFVDSFHETTRNNLEVITPPGKQWKDSLASRGLLNDTGEIYALPTLFVLCDMIKQQNINLLLLTEAAKIEQVPDGFKVALFNCEGFSEILVNKIIDTTSHGVAHTSILKTDAKKYLNAYIYHEQNAPFVFSDKVTTNTLTQRSVFHFPVDLTEDWFSARKRLNEFWLKNQQSLNGWKIAQISSTFAYSMSPTMLTVDEGFQWIPSCSYHNLVQAFDEGGRL